MDSAGNAFVSGLSSSANFPVTAGVYAGKLPDSGQGVFVAKLNASGTALIYSTFLGPEDVNDVRVRIDNNGNAYVLGFDANPGYPITPGAFQTSRSEPPWEGASTNGLVAFLTKLNAAGTALVYSTYFTGAGRFDVDSAGNAYVAGQANSGFPVTRGALQRCLTIYADTFVAQLGPGGALQAASYLGIGSGGYSRALAAGPNGKVYLAAYIDSLQIPGTSGSVPDSVYAVELTIADPNKVDAPCLTLQVENGASFQVSSAVPGELATLSGVGLGPATGVSYTTGCDWTDPEAVGWCPGLLRRTTRASLVRSIQPDKPAGTLGTRNWRIDSNQSGICRCLNEIVFLNRRKLRSRDFSTK